MTNYVMSDTPKIVDHDNKNYRKRWNISGDNRFNGAYYYSKEIVKNIIPKVATDRNWVLVNQKGEAFDHSIVFVHNNLHPEHYDWLSKFEDLVLVCGVESTCEKVEHLGKAVYLPLSIDVSYVSKFKHPKDRSTAFVGRKVKRRGYDFPDGTDYLEGLERSELLGQMARYEKVYAVGRAAIEARCLGCDILPYDDRFPDPSVWKVVDNSEAAKMLQDILNEIDGEKPWLGNCTFRINVHFGDSDDLILRVTKAHAQELMEASSKYSPMEVHGQMLVDRNRQWVPRSFTVNPSQVEWIEWIG